MGLNFKQFYSGVVTPTLRAIDDAIPFSESAELLVTETIWHESDRLQALGQYPRGGITSTQPFGPGLGVASIEKPTWLWMCGTPIGQFVGLDAYGYPELAWDLRLNVVACRLRYFIDQRPLPTLEHGIEARATFWWQVYNGGQVDRRPDYIRNAKAIPWN